MTAEGERRVVLAQIGAPHGVRGEVRVKSFTEAPLDFAAYGALTTADGRTLEVKSARPQKDMVIARFVGIDSREQAEALRHAELSVARSALGDPDDEDEFYLADLVGLAAVSAEGHEIGTVAAVHDFGAGGLLEIRRKGAPDVLVDFSRENVPAIDLDAGRLVVVPPPEVSERDGRTAEDEPKEGGS